MARIPYFDPAMATGRAAAAYEKLPPLNVFRMMGHAGELIDGFTRLGTQILNFTSLDPILREIAIVRVGVLSGATYEVFQHERIARRLGVSDALIAAIHEGPAAAAFDEAQAEVMAFTDDVVANVRPADATFEPLKERLGYKALQELTLTIGYYMMVSRFLETFDVEIEEPEGTTLTVSGTAGLGHHSPDAEVVSEKLKPLRTANGVSNRGSMTPGESKSRWRRLPRVVLALACGVLTGASLAVAEMYGPISAVKDTGSLLIEILHSMIGGEHRNVIFLPDAFIQIEWEFALLYAIIIVIVAVPVWWIMGIYDKNSTSYALVVGFILSIIAGFEAFYGDKSDVIQYIWHTAAIGLAGAVAGLVTWRVSHPRTATLTARARDPSA